MDRGMSYAHAHELATKAEHRALTRDGIDPQAYEAALKPYLDRAKARGVTDRQPPDLEPKPYREQGEEHLLRQGPAAGAAARPGMPAPSAKVANELAGGGFARRAAPKDDTPTPAHGNPVLPESQPSDSTQAPPSSGPGSDRSKNSRAAEAPSGASPEAASPSGVAPGDRLNPRPDLAIHSKDNAVRDLYHTVDEKRTVEPVTHEEQAKRAEEMLSTPEGEKRIEAKLREPGAVLTAAEDRAAAQLVERAYNAGDAQKAAELAHSYRNARTEAARTLGMPDPSQTPAERARAGLLAAIVRPSGRDLMLDNAARAKGKTVSAEVASSRIKRDIERVHDEARKAGIDPLTLESLPKKASVAKTVGKVATSIVQAAKMKKAQLDRDASDILAKLKKSIGGTHTGALGGEALDLLTRYALNRAQAGVVRFGQFAAELAKHMPEMVEHAAQAWEAVRRRQPDLGMDAATDPKHAVALEKAKALADRWAKEDARVRGLSPEARLSELLAAKAKREIPADIKAAVAPIREQAAALRERLRDRDAAILYNADRMLRIAQRVKGDGWDTYYEWVRAGIHTSPKLALKKIASDVANGFYRYAAEGPLARIINAIIPGGKDARSLADLPHIYGGLLPGLAQGWRNALETWRGETSALHEQVTRARATAAIEGRGEFKPETINEFHGGTRLPKALRWVKMLPGGIRWVQAFNDLAETTFARMAVAEHALTSAREKGLTGEQLADHLHAETTDLASDSWTKALAQATEDTGTKAVESKLNPVHWINRAANIDPWNSKSTAEYAAKRALKEATRWTFLFRTLPWNFAARGLMNSPPGVAATIAGRTLGSTVSAARGKGWQYDRKNFNSDVAKGLIGTAVLGLVGAANGGAPTITGFRAGYNPKEENAQPPPPHSIFLFGRWRDYLGLGMFSHVLGTAADLLQARKEISNGGSVAGAGGRFAHKLFEQFKDETVMRNGLDVMAATHDASAAERLAATWSTLAYPTILRQLQSQWSQTKEDHRIHPDGILARVADYAARGTGWSARYAFPDVDLFGNEVKKPNETGSQPWDYLFRLANPFGGGERKTGDDDIKSKLFDYNARHPDAPLQPSEPNPWVTVHGQRRDLTRQEFHDFLVTRGQVAATTLRNAGELDDARLPVVMKKAFHLGTMAAKRKLGAEHEATDE